MQGRPRHRRRGHYGGPLGKPLVVHRNEPAGGWCVAVQVASCKNHGATHRLLDVHHCANQGGNDESAMGVLLLRSARCREITNRA